MHTPDEAFVPLTPSAPLPNGGPESRVSILSSAGIHQPFQPIGQTGAAPLGSSGAACEPHVELQREGDRVSAIRIACKCGQVIELACVYESIPSLALARTAAPSAAPVAAPILTPTLSSMSAPAPAAVADPAPLPELASAPAGAPDPEKSRAKAPSARARR